MEGYEVHQEDLRIGDRDYRIRSLKNLQQFSDNSGAAGRRGISSANWPLFGVVWPAGVVLARLVNQMPLSGLTMLELGCGLGVSSIVAAHRGANITASDYHPLAREFLDENAALNKLDPIKFLSADWANPITRAGKFRLIVGSDVLYERQHPEQLSVFIDCHAEAQCRVIICDPRRRHLNTFTRKMKKLGFTASRESIPVQYVDDKAIGVNVMSYIRDIDKPTIT